MDVGTFRAWLLGMDELTAEQRDEVQEILHGREPGAEVTAAIEDRVDDRALLSALRHRRGGQAGERQRVAAVSVQSLLEELQCPDRDAPGPAAP